MAGNMNISYIKAWYPTSFKPGIDSEEIPIYVAITGCLRYSLCAGALSSLNDAWTAPKV